MFGEAIQAVLDQLVDHKIKATGDTRDLVPPCVWVAPDTSAPITLDGSRDVQLQLYLVAGNAGGMDTITNLDALAAQVETAIHIGQVEAVTVTIPSIAPTPIPAYLTKLTVTVTKE